MRLQIRDTLLSMRGKFRFWDISVTKRAFCFCEAWTTKMRPLILGANGFRHVIQHAVSSLKVFAVFRHHGKWLRLHAASSEEAVAVQPFLYKAFPQ